jgi:hypothetical protein
MRTVKRTGFSGPGETGQDFAGLRSGFALSGSHQSAEAPRHAQIFRHLPIIGMHYRLYGGCRRQPRTPLRSLAILMTIVVNRLMPMRRLIKRQIDGRGLSANIRQTYVSSQFKAMKVTHRLLNTE